MASFGLFNQFQYHSILMLPDMASPASPGEAQLPEDMSLCTHFNANNRVFSSTDGEEAGQGREGSVNRYHWEDTPGREHIRIHTYVMDTSEEIVHWHVYLLADGFVRMENPSGNAWIDVKADMDQVVIRNEKLEEERLFL